MANYSEIRRRDPNTRGMEIFEITPVIVGGDPVNPKNKTLLTREQHMEAVRYWNGLIAELKRPGGERGP